MRLHGDREPHTPPMSTVGGGRMASGGPNEVWSYGETLYEMCRKYMFLRERLRPYITGLMQDAHEKGTPVIRPMFYDFPEDKNCWTLDGQYMFGGSLLVAPVMEAGQRTKTVYLPAGTWYNAWTGEAVEGGRTVEADAPLTVIPVYTRDAGLLGVFKG